jgi:DNA processing protein
MASAALRRGETPTTRDFESQTIAWSDTAYPTVLTEVFGGLDLPPIHAAGNLGLLQRPAVGFCGSRKASEAGIGIATDCAIELSSAGAVVISGYAKGVDTASHKAALAAGGDTIVVLPEGISHFRIKNELKELWDWDRVLVLSQFEPRAIWRADRAMERNSLIVALSRATIVVEASFGGGTYNAGLAALKLRRPLFVVSYSQHTEINDGNKALLEKGAVALSKIRATGRADLKSVIEAVGLATDMSSPSP